MHVVNKNVTQMANRDNSLAPITIAINEHMKRFADYNIHLGECSLFPAVRDLLMNFTLPNEMIPGMPPQPMPNQMHAPSPVGASPNPMMHSPMQAVNSPMQPPMTPVIFIAITANFFTKFRNLPFNEYCFFSFSFYYCLQMNPQGVPYMGPNPMNN